MNPEPSLVGSRARHLAVAALLSLVVVAQTWPLVRHLGTALPGTGPGDNVNFVWNLWWMRHVGWNSSGFFHSDYLLWPFGADLILHTHTILNGVAAATLLSRLSVVEAQNVLVLASVFLNLLSAYALAHDVTRNRAGSVMAAMIFGGAPYFAAHLEGHFNLIAGWVIPVWLLFARRAADSRRMRDAVLAGAALALVAYADYYYLVFSVAAAACLLVVTHGRVRLVCERRQSRNLLSVIVWLLAALLAVLIAWIHISGGTTLRVGGLDVSLRGTFNPRIALWTTLAAAALLRWRLGLRPERVERGFGRTDARLALVAGAVFCGAAIPLVAPAARVIGSGDYVAPPTYFRSASPGIDVVALVNGNPRHPLVGRYVRQFADRLHIDPIEGIGWLGVVPVVLAWFGWRRWPAAAERRAWAWLFGVFLVWALGPFLMVWGWNTALVLPQTALRYLPIVSNARIPGRAMVVVYLALAILSAMGFATRSHSRWPVCTLIVLTIVDYASAPMPLWRVDVPSVYQALRARGDEGALLELPMGIRDGFGSRGSMDPGSPLFQTIHQHPVVGGFVARIPERVKTGYFDDRVFGPLLRASEPSTQTVALPAPGAFHDDLRAKGIRYVILRRSAAPTSMTRLVEEALGASLLARDADRDLFEVRLTNRER